MNEQENLAMEPIAENAEVAAEQITGQEEVAPVQQQPAAEPEKVYTEAEFKAKLEEALDRKAPRMEARIRKEYESKYGELENVLKAGTGKNDVAEITGDFKQFYEGRGVQIPQKPLYNDRDTAVLARAEAEDVIKAGFEEVVEETDRLAKLGVENMNPRERAVFKTLANYRAETEKNRELEKIGVTEEVYGSREFRDFAAKFGSGTSITEIYEIFNKMQPKKEIKPMGSMRNSTSGEGTVKDFYTREEALKFTRKDLDKNPALMKAIEQSMLKW